MCLRVVRARLDIPYRKPALPRPLFFVCSADSLKSSKNKHRGKFRSKNFDDVVAEAKVLVAAGAKELNLVAEDTNQYYLDRRGSGKNLAVLMRELSKIEGLCVLVPVRRSILALSLTCPLALSPTCPLAHSLTRALPSLALQALDPHPLRLPVVLLRRSHRRDCHQPQGGKVHRHAPPAHFQPDAPRHEPSAQGPHHGTAEQASGPHPGTRPADDVHIRVPERAGGGPPGAGRVCQDVQV